MKYANEKIRALGSYAFAEIDGEVARLREEGIQPIDFGVGDPQDPTPESIREAARRGVDLCARSGYPSYSGSSEFREAVAAFMKRRFGVKLDPNQEISATIGSKEAVFNFPNAFIDPGDIVLVPNPGYPPYERGTLFAGGTSYFMNLTDENGFFPDFESIPPEILRSARILWLNYPNNPTTRTATEAFYRKAIAFAGEHGLIIASDEAYTENYYENKPCSILQFGRAGIVVFQSLSKMANMTCYRSGWICGDAEIISVFKKLKTNIDSGTCTFIQDAAAEALLNTGYQEELRKNYTLKRDILVRALREAGLPDCTPQGTIYLWQKCPEGLTSFEFARLLLRKDIAVVVTPGPMLSRPAQGVDPGEGYVRFALVPPVEECRKAAERIAIIKKF
ncbi:MAG: aminotransferase class I/II-fold pyridoxal phosphate-dependent enzyme [bacterium]